MKVKDFFVNLAKGAAIGVAMIIPGVSGGTLAVLFGVYDKIIDSVGNIFKDFKNSFLFLLPILLGAVLAFAAMYLPLQYALDYAPFPTIMLFAGLMLGSIFDLFKKSNKNGFKRTDTIGLVLSCVLVIGICFIPKIGDVDLTVNMPVWGYFLLLLIGMLASCALVVPGISGSMLLLIFGYFQPLFDTISGLRTSFGHSLLVLATFAVGLIIGFFTIAKLMQLLLNKFKRATFWAIVGFVIGSVPAVIITFFHEQEYVSNLEYYCSAWQIAVGVILFVAGGVAAFFLARLAVKHEAKLQSTAKPVPLLSPEEAPQNSEPDTEQ
ncbi:MAG: DUF368 domain-containing protein [Clostridia bacterium]|nr:DUF368 domain-containing protein [Clostridia bacterium]